MKTDTADKIIAYITEKNKATAKELAEYLDISPQALFRQFKKLLIQKKIEKSGSPPVVFYHLPINKKQQMTQNVFNWVQSARPDISGIEDLYCSTRDIFEARNKRIIKLLIDAGKDESFTYLLSAVIGELGNNSFDHNIANWPDIPGVYFVIDAEAHFAIIADRGRGIRATLANIRPNISTDVEALKIAFTETISGRSPEQRGNGLKFVRKTVIDLGWELKFYSGVAIYSLFGKNENFMQINDNVRGTIALISF